MEPLRFFKKSLRALNTAIRIRNGARVPFRITHITTTRCNLRCKYCGRWNSEKKDMSTGEILSAMDEFSSAGTRAWDFSGGEPLIREDIGELVDKAYELDFSCVLVTNGTLLKERLADVKKIKKIGAINISLDGPKEIHDIIRGKGSFDRALEGIKYAKSKGYKVHLSSVISRENTQKGCKSLFDLFDIAKGLDCPIYLQPVYNSRYNHEKFPSLIPDEKDHKKAINLIRAFKYDNPTLNQTSERTLRWFEGAFSDEQKWDCLAGRAYAFLFPDGVVAPCFFKEDKGINGLENGFSKAFQMLELPDPMCKCMITCCVESNFQYGLSISEVEAQIKRFFTNK
ncbi:MAG: radical SAM protein [Candidatus Altiarchaeota archaeon]|nr:radical SAM protein [Candidatus Altiarchaeota archaeon]